MKIIRTYQGVLVKSGFQGWMEKNKLTLCLVKGLDIYVATIKSPRGCLAKQITDVNYYVQLESIFTGIGKTEKEAFRNLGGLIHGKYVCFDPPGGIPYKLVGGWE